MYLQYTLLAKKKMVCTIELITFDDGNFRDVMKLVIFNIFNHLSKSGE